MRVGSLERMDRWIRILKNMPKESSQVPKFEQPWWLRLTKNPLVSHEMGLFWCMIEINS